MNDHPGRRRDKTRQRETDEVPEPQIFQSRVFRTIAWTVLVLLAVSVILLLVMAIVPMN